MHAAQLFCDRVLLAVLMLRQPLDPPDLGKELADLLFDVIAFFAQSWVYQLAAPACPQIPSPKIALAFYLFPFLAFDLRHIGPIIASINIKYNVYQYFSDIVII